MPGTTCRATESCGARYGSGRVDGLVWYSMTGASSRIILAFMNTVPIVPSSDTAVYRFPGQEYNQAVECTPVWGTCGRSSWVNKKRGA